MVETLSTKHFQLFMLPDEFIEVVLAAITELNLWAACVRLQPQHAVELMTGTKSLIMSDDQNADQVFLSAKSPDVKTEAAVEYPIKFGMIRLDLPLVKGDVLYLAELASKSDWYNEKSGRIFLNRSSHQLLHKVKCCFVPRLHYPVWGYNVVSLKAGKYRDIGYSDEVLKWVENGGQLMQRWATNIRFSLKKPELA